MTPNAAGKIAKGLGTRYGLTTAQWLGLRRILIVLDEGRAAGALAEVAAVESVAPLWNSLSPAEWRQVKAHRKADRAATPDIDVGYALNTLSNRAARALAEEWAPVLGLTWRERRQLSRLAAQLGEDRTRDVLANVYEQAEGCGALDALALAAVAD